MGSLCCNISNYNVSSGVLRVCCKRDKGLIASGGPLRSSWSWRGHIWRTKIEWTQPIKKQNVTPTLTEDASSSLIPTCPSTNWCCWAWLIDIVRPTLQFSIDATSSLLSRWKATRNLYPSKSLTWNIGRIQGMASTISTSRHQCTSGE